MKSSIYLFLHFSFSCHNRNQTWPLPLNLKAINNAESGGGRGVGGRSNVKLSNRHFSSLLVFSSRTQPQTDTRTQNTFTWTPTQREREREREACLETRTYGRVRLCPGGARLGVCVCVCIRVCVYVCQCTSVFVCVTKILSVENLVRKQRRRQPVTSVNVPPHPPGRNGLIYFSFSQASHRWLLLWDFASYCQGHSIPKNNCPPKNLRPA